MGTTIIKNARVLDCTGQNPYRADVTISGNRIESVSGAMGGVGNGSAAPSRYDASLGRPSSAGNGYNGASTVIDANGATLMPGLVEAHAHPSFLNFERIEEVGEIPPEEHALATVKNVGLMLEHGFTSLFCAASARKRVDIIARNAVNSGQFPGPRMMAASPEMTPTAGLGDVNMDHMERLSFAIVCDGADEFRKTARMMVREGADVLKINPSGDEFVPHNKGHVTCMTEAEIAAVCEVGIAHDKVIAAHARSAQSVKWCLKHGAQVIYHANYSDEEALSMMVDHRDRIFVAPAIGIAVTTLNEAEDYGITREMAIELGIQDALEYGARVMKHLLQAGVRVLPGGDYGFAWNPVGTNARDLEHFVKYLGMSPMEVLMSATKWGGEIMQMGGELGQVQPGYLADLILVDGDPVADIRVLQDASRILCVMKDGVVEKNIMAQRGAGALRSAA
jgi:imidazolonepropionase-like amidohydrolase